MAASVSVGELEATFRLKDQITSELKAIGKTVGDVSGRITDAASKAVPSLGESLSRLGGGMKSFGTALTVGVTAPIVGVGAAAIAAGMDAVESENLFEVSFGNMAGAAREWSEKTSDALGLNEYELRRNSATIYTMSESMGLSKQAAFDMATGISELSADMASFRNLSVEEAFEKIRSGIVGEAEPLKQLGILVDENTVKMTAYKKGIAEYGAELTQQQKVQARWAAILQQTSKDQGDLARTMDSPTNQIKAMRAAFEETTIQLGTAMLPVLRDAIAAIKSLVPYVQSAVTWFAELPESTRNWGIGLAAVAAAAGPVLFVMGGLVSSIGSITTALGTATGAVTTFKIAVGGLSLGPLSLAFAGLAAAGAILYTELNKGTEAMRSREQAAADAKLIHDAWNSSSKLSAEQQKELQDAIDRTSGSLKNSTRPIVDLSAATGGLKITLADAKAGFESTGEEVKQFSDEVRGLIDEISGKKAQREVDNLAEAVNALGGASKISRYQQIELGDALAKLIPQGVKLGSELQKLWDKYRNAQLATDKFSLSSKVAWGGATDLTDALSGYRTVMLSLPSSILAAEVAQNELNLALMVGFENVQEMNATPLQTTMWDDWKVAGQGAMDSIVSGMSQSISNMLLGMSSFSDGMRGIWDAIKNGVAGVLDQMIGKFLNDFIKTGTDALKSFITDGMIGLNSLAAMMTSISNMGAAMIATEWAKAFFGPHYTIGGGEEDERRRREEDERYFPQTPGYEPPSNEGTGNPYPFAAGGVVTRPTVGLVGEAGPEAIIPLKQWGGMGGDTHIHIHADGAVFADESAMRRFASLLMPQIAYALRREGLAQ